MTEVNAARSGVKAARSGVKAAMLATALASVLLAAVPGGAIAAPSNAASTHAFILADHAFAKASDANVGVMKRKLKAAKSALLRQCGGSAKESPQNERSYKMSYEVAGALWSVSYGADAGPIDRLERTVNGLTWTSSRLTRAARSYAKSLHELATLPMPHVCADIATWKASGYRMVPARTKRFDRRVEAIEVTPVAAKLLKPYEQPGDASLLGSTESLRRRLLNFETVVGGNAWYSLLEGLGLNP